MRAAPLLAALLVLLSPLAGAATTTSFPTGSASLFFSTTSDCAAEAPTLAPGTSAFLCARWTPGTATGTADLRLAVTNATALTFPTTSVNRSVPLNGTAPAPLSLAVTAGAAETTARASGNLTLNATSGSETRAFVITIDLATSPAGPTGPNWPLVAAVAVLVAAGASGAYVLLRKKQVKAAPRSSAMQQAEMEKRLEKAKAPEEKAAIQAEMQAVEEQRTLSREAQIVEAKIKDVRSGLDRLRERHEAGQLTQHQYTQMRGKRETQLEELERELERLMRPE